MKLIPIADAKAHLSEILAALGPGEEVVVTRHGVPVARVVGVGERNREKSVDIIKRIRERAKRLNLGLGNDNMVRLAKAGRRSCRR